MRYVRPAATDISFVLMELYEHRVLFAPASADISTIQ